MDGRERCGKAGSSRSHVVFRTVGARSRGWRIGSAREKMKATRCRQGALHKDPSSATPRRKCNRGRAEMEVYARGTRTGRRERLAQFTRAGPRVRPVAHLRLWARRDRFSRGGDTARQRRGFDATAGRESKENYAMQHTAQRNIDGGRSPYRRDARSMPRPWRRWDGADAPCRVKTDISRQPSATPRALRWEDARSRRIRSSGGMAWGPRLASTSVRGKRHRVILPNRTSTTRVRRGGVRSGGQKLDLRPVMAPRGK